MTADLIRFPTINPPGEAYRPCAEYIAERLRKRSFGVEFIRAEGTPGDSDRYPRGWLFHHRWGKNADARTARGERIRHITVGGRTTAWVPGVQR